MEYSFYDFLKLLGSLALFLYGMKIMSEGLQKFAGDRLRKILTAMTTNRVTGVLTGVLITALIQSSSATTVMVVSFVNAGLLTLSQSIGVIMGANIGTTLTAWIIAIFGFELNFSIISIPMVGFAESLNISVSAAIVAQRLAERIRQPENGVAWQLAPEDRDRLLLRWLCNSVRDYRNILRRGGFDQPTAPSEPDTPSENNL